MAAIDAALASGKDVVVRDGCPGDDEKGWAGQCAEDKDARKNLDVVAGGTCCVGFSPLSLLAGFLSFFLSFVRI